MGLSPAPHHAPGSLQGLLTASTQHLAGSGTRARRNENSSFLNVRQEMISAKYAQVPPTLIFFPFQVFQDAPTLCSSACLAPRDASPQEWESPFPPHQGVCNAQYVGALRFQWHRSVLESVAFKNIFFFFLFLFFERGKAYAVSKESGSLDE